MRIGVLGTGVVGQTLGAALVECGHTVALGSRTADNEAATDWAARTGGACATFAHVAAESEVLINATAGTVSLAALRLAGSDNIGAKTLIDVANPLDFSNGFPPTLSVCNTTSLAESLQEEFPDARVVKALNTVNADVMVAPELLGTQHVTFIAGNDEAAKSQSANLLGQLGWQAPQIVDLGDLTGARACEMYLPLWVRLFASRGSANFNIALVTS